MWSRMEKQVWLWLLRPNMIWSCLITFVRYVGWSIRRGNQSDSLASVDCVGQPRKKLLSTKSIQRFCCFLYGQKPFIISDLVDKITAIFRGRDYIDQHCSQMKIPTLPQSAHWCGTPYRPIVGKTWLVDPSQEYDLLATLMGNKGVVTRDQLLESVQEYEVRGDNIVDVYISVISVGKLIYPVKSYKDRSWDWLCMQDALE